jgi:hypothetical protein
MLQRLHGECGAGAAGAVEDGAPFRIEFPPMILIGRIRVELEHSAGCMHTTRNCALFPSLFGLTKVHQQDAAAIELSGDQTRGQVLDALLGLIDPLGCRVAGLTRAHPER